jgi:hypothetical protein
MSLKPSPYDSEHGTFGWRDVKCDTGVLKDKLQPGEQQWADSKAEGAWIDMIAAWKTSPTKDNAKFPVWLANYFGAPIGMGCTKVGAGECQVCSPVFYELID